MRAFCDTGSDFHMEETDFSGIIFLTMLLICFIYIGFVIWEDPLR